MKEQILLGKWTEEKLNLLLSKSSSIKDPGMRIDFLSGHFLITDYKESTLIGDISTPEVFVINLEGVDCFTLLDYIEAMRLSDSFIAFKKNLKKVRYRSGEVSFEDRNHFFSDWLEFNSNSVDNVSEYVSSGKSHHVRKRLNEKDDETFFIPGLPCREREILFIPSEAIDSAVIEKLKTGDYVGIYSEKPGLDVSHVGIVIKAEGSVYLRHASSAKEYRKVIDQDFKSYISEKPGLIVLRPKN